ncbi:histidyl-tRNA synthetase, putative [Babesia caballi]|uniref:histidine--tRNA ligase n=1 Tax=Babesia caballi TaxID=5871 RepID=A0AAV4LL65_BABCB|nr:histidyl-tRNA synthetase, putative [Babesia caballi]
MVPWLPLVFLWLDFDASRTNCLRRAHGPPAFVAPQPVLPVRHRHTTYAKSGENVALHTVRGGQCFMPREQMEQRQLQDQWLKVARSFGFAEYFVGVLAHAELFDRSAVAHSDREHRNELYEFTDRKGRRLALRGDVTPQFMAMLRDQRDAAGDLHRGDLGPNQTSKWFTLADCWRYERPGRCRRRNHLQWTCDIVGSPGVDAEIELMTMLVTFFRQVGPVGHFRLTRPQFKLTSDDIAIHISHRDAAAALLHVLGKSVPDTQWLYEFRKVLDKYRKASQPELAEQLSPLGFSSGEADSLFEITSGCRSLSSLEQILPPDSAFIGVLRAIWEGLERAQCADWLTIDLSIVRGSDYYTGTVFECFDRLQPQRRAIAGGGRYDNYFGYRQPSYGVGFGMGNVAVADLLRSRGLFSPGGFADVVVFTPPMSADKDEVNNRFASDVISTISEMRRRGFRVYQYYKTGKRRKALEFAERLGATTFICPRLNSGSEDLFYEVHDVAAGCELLVALGEHVPDRRPCLLQRDGEPPHGDRRHPRLAAEDVVVKLQDQLVLLQLIRLSAGAGVPQHVPLYLQGLVGHHQCA